MCNADSRANECRDGPRTTGFRSRSLITQQVAQDSAGGEGLSLGGGRLAGVDWNPKSFYNNTGLKVQSLLLSDFQLLFLDATIVQYRTKYFHLTGMAGKTSHSSHCKGSSVLVPPDDLFLRGVAEKNKHL